MLTLLLPWHRLRLPWRCLATVAVGIWARPGRVLRLLSPLAFANAPVAVLTLLLPLALAKVPVAVLLPLSPLALARAPVAVLCFAGRLR